LISCLGPICHGLLLYVHNIYIERDGMKGLFGKQEISKIDLFNSI